MTNEQNLHKLAVKLFDIDAVKFGQFTTKSGMKTPVYFDLRVIVSYPDIMDLISNLLYDFSMKDTEYDHLCGVPYTALPVATLLSVRSKKSMLMRRKEAKNYGTKKMIEGHYKAGQSCIIIEDVITSGSSVLETVKDLRNEGLKADKALVILDREQGGRQNLEKNNVHVEALITMSKLMEILVKKEKIDSTMAKEVQEYLLQAKAPSLDVEVDRTLLTYEKRSECASNTIAKQLFNIMALKKTNLCLSVDLTSATSILEVVEKVGEHICLLKTHIDIIEDFNSDFIANLKNLAKRFNFLILEDRKFADIGNTVVMQYSKGTYKIAEWANCVTVHSLPGEGILKAISTCNGVGSQGIFLLAEMSSKGNLITAEYIAETVKMASKYPNLITGFVGQNKGVFKDPGYIQLTPGVQLECTEDELGQVYNTPEKVILEKGADVVVVGRGIVSAKSPAAQAVIYKNILWKYYLKRVSDKIE
ncbi:hypothetical protein evm_007267 [Chilo suppressalis]|nr:hypothetical protein evm_007267 [Chilo suppressalis]